MMSDSDLFQETYTPINKQLEIKERDLKVLFHLQLNFKHVNGKIYMILKQNLYV